LSGQDIYHNIINASNYVAIIPALVAVFTYRRHSRTQRYLAILVWGVACVGLCNELFVKILGGRPTLWLLPFYATLEFTMYTLIFRHFIPQRFIRYLIAGFAVYSLTYGIITDFFTFGEPLRVVSALSILIYCIRYFLATLQQLDEENITLDPMFWISSGSFIYYSASFLFFLTIGFLVDMKEVDIVIWVVHALFAIILYAFFFLMAFLKRPATTR